MEADVRRFLILLIIMIAAFPALSSPAIGYSLAPVGELSPNEPYGALNIALFFSPDREIHAGDVEMSVDLSPYGHVFQAANLRISTPVFATTDHPFNVLFPNTMLWAPKVSLGGQYRMPDEWNILLGIAPFSFQDTNFVFEFFSPYALYSITEDSWGWGMYVLRFSYFFGHGEGRR